MATVTVSISYGLNNELTTKVETVGDILHSDRIKAGLGFGDSVEPIVNGAVVDSNYPLSEGDQVALRARAGSKGYSDEGVTTTVSFGLDNSITTKATTVGSILSNERIKAFLGFDAAAVEAVINGAVVGSNYLLAEGDSLTLRQKAGTKGFFARLFSFLR